MFWQLKRSRTFLGYLNDFVGAWILLALVGGYLVGQHLIGYVVRLWPIIPIVLVCILVVGLLKRWLLRHHTDALHAFAQARGLQFATDIDAVAFEGKLGAVTRMYDSSSPTVLNLLNGDDWRYCDFCYYILGRSKYGDYRKAVVYYGIMSTELPRSLPNVFFDSVRARRRQFRFHFAAKQRHSLEGDFDKYFDTYFPPDYTIDSLSFVGPDVMWAMKDAADYDIEIFGNRVFLYGPIGNPAQQIPDMSAKILAIKKQLQVGITAYRDERLPFEAGRQSVSWLGANLKLSKFWTLASVAAILFVFVLQIVLGFIR